MKHQFFIIRALDPAAGQDDFNRFCAAHRIVSLDRQFVADGGSSFWSVCVAYEEGDGVPQAQRKPRVDYKELLSERDFAQYAELRSLRKALAEREGLPAYTLFTNEQLAEMVRQRVDSVAALGKIEGVGPARLDKYGEAFVQTLCRLREQTDAPSTD